MAELRIVFMDAGQGDATLVVYPDGSLMLVDCGSVKSSQVTAPQIRDAINQFLKPNKIIQTLILTHPDQDHYNQLNYITNAHNITYNEVYYGGTPQQYSKSIHPILAQGTLLPDQHYDKKKHPKLSRAGVEVWMLAANAKGAGASKSSNDNSIVLLLRYAGISIFLMGDATKATEDFILNRHKKKPTILDQPLRTDRVVLKVGHHGSKTSSTSAWIKRIEPQAIFISSDNHNGYHLPKSSVIDNIISWGNINPGNSKNAHSYVQYNEWKSTFEPVPTNSYIFTNLYKMKNNSTEGTSHHYIVKDTGAVSIETP